ncbi:TPA: GIY-YIG nuclease family protein [Escherichia coli]|nr:GIY-YIG nuclease family protein [Escherichia coli]
MLCRCKVCGDKWFSRPDSLKQGQGCPKCAVLKRAQKLRLSHEEHVADVIKINPDIEVLEEITGANKKVLCRCKVCDYEWMPTPSHLKSGQGCPKCAGNIKLSHKEQIAVIAKVNPNIEILGEITGSQKKVLCRCKICDHKWMGIPKCLKSGVGCPKCAGVAKLSHEEQVAAIAKVNPDIEVLGEIKNTHTKTLCRCKVCDHKWMIAPDTVKRGHGCPKCAKYGFLSHDYGKLYIMTDDLEVPTMMKIGVSVNENKRRNDILKSAHKAGVRLPDLHIVKTWEGPTDYMYEIESMLHDAFSDYRINFPVKFDGSNEFFHYRPDVFYVAQDAWLAIVANAAA